MKAQEEPTLPFPIQVPNLQYQNQKVYTALWLIDIYSFDYKTGSYTFDFYTRFFWVDPNIKSIEWYIQNGYPAYPGAKQLVAFSYNDTVKWELYRTRATLDVTVETKDYPFDQIRLPISIELLTNASEVSVVWVQNQTGIGSGYDNVGWTTPSFELTTPINHNDLGFDSPSADFIVIQNRLLYTALLETILPPLIFAIVGLSSFLFEMYESNAFSLRIGINTSMLITAVLFNIAEQTNLPPMTKLTFYDVFISSVIAFLAASLVVTVLGYVNWMHHGDKKRVDAINRWGLVVSIAIPLVLFLVWFAIK